MPIGAKMYEAADKEASEAPTDTEGESIKKDDKKSDKKDGPIEGEVVDEK